ncbi:MAG TPA: hypothetical protein DDX93_03305 [Smithella sp.]|nr:hypothetical protein [Smithella sp.]
MNTSNILSYATFLLVLVFSTTLFAADAPAGNQNPRKTPFAVTPSTAPLNKLGNLPPLIKINAVDVNMNMDTAMIDGAMEKAKTAGKNISLNSGEIAKWLPKLEQSISIYRKKVDECRNKTYTTEDQKNAYCTASTTIAECSQKLFSACIYGKSNDVLTYTHYLYDAAKKTEADAKQLNESAHYIQSNNSQYAH